MLRLHAFAPCSTVNGPGIRAVIWVQGCQLHCIGCFNEATHNRGLGHGVDPIGLANHINKLNVRGLTVSGGEPLQQAKSLALLLGALDSEKDVLLYSGYSVAEAMKAASLRAVLLRCDAALMGRYRSEDRHPYDNKELVIRTGRITPEELKPHRTVEVIVGRHEGLVTGFPQPRGINE